MNICVCVKQVEETYARTGKDPQQYFLDPEDRIYRINPYDEAAMVMARKAAAGLQDARIIVITLGPMQAEDELWRIMAMGGDQLCHVELSRPGKGNALDSRSKAQVLADAIEAVGGDLVLCGKESIDRQNGLVAGFIAHELKRPFVSAIMDVSVQTGARGARITKNAGKGIREIVDCRLPAVFSVDLYSGAPCMPSYEAKQQARLKTVTHMLLDSRPQTSKTRRIQITAPRPRPKPVAAPDSRLPSFERVRQLLTGSRIQKKGKIITGSPELQVDEIIHFLEEHGIVSPSDSEAVSE